MPPELSLFSEACQAVSVPGTVALLASPSVQQLLPLPAFPPRHSTAPPRPQTPEGVKGCLRYVQPLFLLVCVKLDLNIQNSSIFVLLLGCIDSRFFVLFREWLIHAKCPCCHDSVKLKLNTGSQRSDIFCQAYLSTKGLWWGAVILVSSPKSAPLLS